MTRISEQAQFFGQEKISKILWRLAPPVMLAQLIQALYNIVDSFFVGRDSAQGLTALSIVYPMQLLMIALAVGTGVGINTAMAARLGVGRRERAAQFAGMAAPLAGGPLAGVCPGELSGHARLRPAFHRFAPGDPAGGDLWPHRLPGQPGPLF